MLVDQCLNGGRAPRPDIVDHLYRVFVAWTKNDWLIDWLKRKSPAKSSRRVRDCGRLANSAPRASWLFASASRRVELSVKRSGREGGGVLTGFTGGHREACESPPPLRSLISRQGLRDVSTADIGARRQITTGYRHLRRTVRRALTDYHRQAARWKIARALRQVTEK